MLWDINSFRELFVSDMLIIQGFGCLMHFESLRDFNISINPYTLYSIY